MSPARRPLLTATAAASVLGALWFVPSANATDDRSEAAKRAAEHQARSGKGAQDVRLAETGAVSTTPYLVGGSLFLAAGAGCVAYSMRRGATA
ncbi:LAETG motif-containing sortase-dependent surface protein [Streptomyces sp. NPDC002851]